MAKPKAIDHMGNIEKALNARNAAREALNAITGSERTLEEKLPLGKKRVSDLVEKGLAHLDYWGRGQGSSEHHWIKLFGENNSHAEPVFAAMHADEIGHIVDQAMEAAHQRHVAAGGMVISAADLPGKIAEAENKLFTAECYLETTYTAAEEAGFVVNRDPDLSPEAVLGIKRNELLPHDYFNEKMERIIASRDGSHAAYRAAHERWQDARHRLATLNLGSDPNEADIKDAEKLLAHCRSVVESRQEELQAKTKLAEALEEYVKTHRKLRPCEPFHNPHKRPEPVAEQPKPENWQDRFNADEESEIEAE